MKALSTHAAAAKAIRQFIKAKGLKASVRSDCYAGGDSVHADLYDATPEAFREVEAFAGAYQMGHFDGMTDSYDYSSRNRDLPQVKFVFVTPHYSADLKQAAWTVLRGYLSGADALPAAYGDLTHHRIWNEHATTYVYQFLRGTMRGLEAKSAEFWKQAAAA